MVLDLFHMLLVKGKISFCHICVQVKYTDTRLRIVRATASLAGIKPQEALIEAEEAVAATIVDVGSNLSSRGRPIKVSLGQM